MSALITCPYCDEFTELTGTLLMVDEIAVGRDKCNMCGEMFHYEYEVVNVKTERIKKRGQNEQ